MHPELLTLPICGASIKAYGFCLMIGFLSAVWLAMRRAERVKANPDTVLDLSILALVFGVGGARLFYVVHYWQVQFAGAPNKFLALIDITQGGLEFLGGLLGALIAIALYSWWKKISIRLYLDILAPGVAWGLAFGRIGCFLNGCCFGGLCVVSGTAQPAYPWAVQFPFASPAHWRQWEDREVTVPAELIASSKGSLMPILVPASALSMSVEKREMPLRRFKDAEADYNLAKAESPGSPETARLERVMKTLEKKKQDHEVELAPLRRAQLFPSRHVPTRPTSVTELEDLAAKHLSKPVHPTQLYSSIHGFLLSGFLSALFYLRKRHGLVIGMLFVMYPIFRVLVESIRVDNPHDIAGLTVSQFIGVGLFVLGVVYLTILYRWLPERSPVLDSEVPSKRSEGA